MKPRNVILAGLILGTCSQLVFGQVQAPALSPSEGEGFAQFPLSISCATPGAEIHYTLNGAEPTLFDPAINSGGTIIINRNWTVKARAWLGGVGSTTTTGIFTLTGDLAGGGAHSLALKTPGGIWAWGLQTGGRLGNNSSTAANITSPVYSRYSSGAVGDARMIAAGTDHSVFLKDGGTVWSFGTNATGQLGDNSTTNRTTAVQVKKSTGATDWLTGSVAVAAGQGFSLALASNGEVYAWGDKTSGRVGDGTTTGTRLYAGKVYQGTSGTTALAGIDRIAASGGTGLALHATTGNVWSWGNNASGQLGQGNQTNLARALRMKLTSSTYVTDVVDIACAPDHTVLLRWKSGDPALQGRVFCAGQQQYGRLGNNLTAAAPVTYPVQVLKSGGTPLDNVISVAAGSAHTLALDGTGKVWAWGYNLYGALGDNTTTHRAVAVKVKNPAGTGDLANIVRIAAGGSGLLGHSLAVASDGTVYAWGYNANGQLGNATTSTAATKLPVAVAGGFKVLPQAPDVALSHSVGQSFNPGSVTLTAVPTDPDNNITKVEYYSQGVLIGQSTAPPWTWSMTGLPAGSYHTYAVVTDAAGFTGYSPPSLFSIAESSPPSVVVSASVLLHEEPGYVSLAAVPSDPDGLETITSAGFYIDGQLIATSQAPEWIVHVPNLSAGPHQTHAVVYDSAGMSGQSQAVQFTIHPPTGQVDSDADGMPDWWEAHYGLDPNDPSDATADLVEDGVTNLIKYKTGRNPLVSALSDASGVLSLRVLTPLE